MSKTAELLISGFSDESSRNKIVDEQFSIFAALGMRYVTLRFLDVGKGIKNIMQLDESDLDSVCQKLDDYGLQVSSLGSPIGKVKLLDVEDGTTNIYRPFDEYLRGEVNRAINIAKKLDTRLIRGFSFYHPRNSAAADHFDVAVSRLRTIAERCDEQGLTFGLEVEANLIGHTGELMARLYESIDHPALVLIFDGGNLVTQGFSQEEIWEQWLMMKPGIGWIHIKDYLSEGKTPDAKSWIDEDRLNRFVPADRGESGYGRILTDLATSYEIVKSRMSKRGIPGIFADLEPHLRQGGQFGGFSGADGFGVAFRSFCQIAAEAGFMIRLRGFDDIQSRPR